MRFRRVFKRPAGVSFDSANHVSNFPPFGQVGSSGIIGASRLRIAATRCLRWGSAIFSTFPDLSRPFPVSGPLELRPHSRISRHPALSRRFRATLSRRERVAKPPCGDCDCRQAHAPACACALGGYAAATSFAPSPARSFRCSKPPLLRPTRLHAHGRSAATPLRRAPLVHRLAASAALNPCSVRPMRLHAHGRSRARSFRCSKPPLTPSGAGGRILRRRWLRPC